MAGKTALQHKAAADGKFRFSMPPVSKLSVRELVNDCGGAELVQQQFGLTPELLGLWISGEVVPPRYFLIALWWQSWHGFDQGFAETHYANHLNYRRMCDALDRAEKLEGRIAHLEDVVRRASQMLGDQGAYYLRIAFADRPFFREAGDPRSGCWTWDQSHALR